MSIQKQSLSASLLASAIALTGCGSDSDPANPGFDGRSGSETSGLVISAKGGDAPMGYAGQGGYLYAMKTNSASDLNILKAGNIDAGYSLPDHTPEFGTNPVTISASQTIELVEDDIIPPANTLYMVPGEDFLFLSTGDVAVADDSHIVTGLIVEEGATLFLPDNYGESLAELVFNNDVQNDGVIATVNGTYNYRTSLDLVTAAYYGTGDINVSGNTDSYNRQNGGSVSITALTIQNSGLINTSGANQSGTNITTSGHAGNIDLEAYIFIENTGELRANGGSSDQFSGSRAGDVYLSSDAIYNSGNITANQGTGISQDSYYNTEWIEMYATNTIINTGNISALGADAADTGNAGKGGNVYFFVEQNYGLANDKTLINTGNINVSGGSISEDNSFNAGNGGRIYLLTEEPYFEMSPAGMTFEITGNLIADGGNGVGEAGDGGFITVKHFDSQVNTADTFLLGYDEINTSGGSGVYAGSGGDIDLLVEDVRDYYSYDNSQNVPTLQGALLNTVNLIANGGSTVVDETLEDFEYGTGSNGGWINLGSLNYTAHFVEGKTKVTSEGDIFANGGNSYNRGSLSQAHGGYFRMTSNFGSTLSGSIQLNGGSDLHTASAADSDYDEGSFAGYVFVGTTHESANINAEISLNGGNGNLIGGDAGAIIVNTLKRSDIAGSITALGGNAIASETDSLETEGGDGGYVEVYSADMDSSLDVELNLEGGEGDDAGAQGTIFVDADCLSNNCFLSL